MNARLDPNQREMLEAAFQACISTIDGADAGAEEDVFSERAPHAVRHALGAGWERDVIVDRLDNAGVAIGLSPEVRTRILGEALVAAEARTAVDDIVGGMEKPCQTTARPKPLSTTTPVAWKGTEPAKQKWVAGGRIPRGDLTLFSGNGGAGKTETAMQLLIAVAATLGDWLGCVVESGGTLFLSCEESETNIRDRVERICKQRCIDPHAIENLHLHFPDLEETWLVTVDRSGRVLKTPLFLAFEAWVATNKPRLIIIDSIAAVFDGEAIARRQVRAFLARLRKIAREHDTAIVLLDHPSVRGMSDGSGTANSVDWRNSVRSMLHLSDPDKEDQDLRVLEVKKSNYGRAGEKVTLRWDGLSFVPDCITSGAPSPYRAAAEQNVDEVFLRLLDKRNVQGRPVHDKNAKGSAPTEFAQDPDAGGVNADGFRRAMERLFSAAKIRTVETGPPSRRRWHLERVSE